MVSKWSDAPTLGRLAGCLKACRLGDTVALRAKVDAFPIGRISFGEAFLLGGC